MQLEIENQPTQYISSTEELRQALEMVGKGDSSFAVLGRERQHYIQTARLGQGFIVEFRNGSDDQHYSSKRTNLSQPEMIAVFLAYYEGRENWPTMLQWEPPLRSLRPAKQLRPRKLATRRNAAIVFVAGILALLGSHLQHLQAEDLERNLGETTGLVLTAKETGVRNRGRWLDVKVRYTVDGKALVFDDRLSGVTYRPDDVVPVIYDTRDPAGTSQVGTAGDIWKGYYFLLVTSAGFGLVAGVLFILAQRRSSVHRRPRRTAGNRTMR